MNTMPRWLIIFRRILLALIIFPLLGLTAWTWGALKYVYASGERAGYVQKFSKRGWLFKTWEGELAMVTLPGTAPEIFYFTVRDAQVAKKVTQAVGQRVALHYDQHKGIPGTIFGETPYFVTDATPTTQQLP